MPMIPVYRRPAKDPKDTDAPTAFGVPEDIQVGDAVTYWDPVSSFSAGRVEKINAEARVLRIAALYYKGAVVRPTRKLPFGEIISAQRKPPDEEAQYLLADSLSNDPQVSEEKVESPPLRVKKRNPRLPPAGTVVEKIHNGKRYKVRVNEDSFEFEGKVYKTLDKVATKILGQNANGLIFFKL